MTPLQQIMVSGSHKAGCLENTADCVLYTPAYLWRGRSVQLIEENEDLNARYGNTSWNKRLYIEPNYVGCFRMLACFSAPLLAVGACLKWVALQSDPVAKDYNELATKHLEELGDMSGINPSERDETRYLEATRFNKVGHFQALETQLSQSQLELSKVNTLLDIVKEDIQNAPEKSIPFLGQNLEAPLSYKPKIKDGFIVDYVVSNFLFSGHKMYTTRNTLLKDVSELNLAIAKLEKNIQAIKALPDQFLKDVNNLMGSQENKNLLDV